MKISNKQPKFTPQGTRKRTNKIQSYQKEGLINTSAGGGNICDLLKKLEKKEKTMK